MSSFDVMFIQRVKEFSALKRESELRNIPIQKLLLEKRKSENEPHQTLETTPIRLRNVKTSSYLSLENSTPKTLISRGSTACFHCGSKNITLGGRGVLRVDDTRGQRIRCKECGKSSTIG